MILKKKKAAQFLSKIKNKSDRERQLIIAKLTGNFKRGNEWL